MNAQVLTRNQIRTFDRIAIETFGIPSIVLMENAARGVADKMCELENKSSAAILCGKGNNGGDGLALARHLHLRGWNCTIVLLDEPETFSGDSGINYRSLSQTSIPVRSVQNPVDGQLNDLFSGFQWIVDGITGIGACPPLCQNAANLVSAANLAQARKLAIDLPSGLDSDSDREVGAIFNADFTVTFVAEKPVMQTETGKRYCGEITIVDIGAPPEVFDYLTELEKESN